MYVSISRWAISRVRPITRLLLLTPAHLTLQGPTENSPPLYAFLKEQGQIATHFFIGVNIKGNPDIFMTAYNQQDEVACHTW